MYTEYKGAAQIQRLIGLGKYQEAEAILAVAYAEWKPRNRERFGEVLSLLVSLFSAKGNRDLEKAERYQLERERLNPDPLAKWSTALFYLWTDLPQKVVEKVNEIHFLAREDDDEDTVLCDRHNYYSCLALKGQALIQLGRIPEAQDVLDEMIRMVRANPGRVQLRSGMNVNPLSFGDEMNLMQAAIEVPELRENARQLLQLVTSRIRDEEFRERGLRYLKGLEGLNH